MLRIGGKAIRGVKGSCNAKADQYRNIDVTSGSRAKLGKHSGKDFSPIAGNLLVHDDGRIFQQFENWWQGNKVYKHLNHTVKRGRSHSTTKAFTDFQNRWAAEKKGRRVIPETKHNGRRTTPLFAVYDGQQYNYRDARWVYTGKYCEVVKKTPAFRELVKLYRSGEPIMLIDHDGPPSKQYPKGRPANWTTIEAAFNNLSRPYSHAYVLAAMLLNAGHQKS